MVRVHDRAKPLTQQWLRSGEERKGQGPLRGRGVTAVHQHHLQGCGVTASTSTISRGLSLKPSGPLEQTIAAGVC